MFVSMGSFIEPIDTNISRFEKIQKEFFQIGCEATPFADIWVDTDGYTMNKMNCITSQRTGLFCIEKFGGDNMAKRKKRTTGNIYLKEQAGMD